MLNKLFHKWLKKEKEKEKCKHNWVIVEISDEYWVNYDYGNNKGYKKYKIKYMHFSPYFNALNYYNVTNSVCTLCGECDPGIQKAKDWIKKEEKEAKKAKKDLCREKVLAKQLWEDGCKNLKKETPSS